MITGRRSSDWLSASSGEGERRADDRRGADRRAPRRRFDPLFAASLVNQIAPTETVYVSGYRETPSPLRQGVVVNLRA